MHDTEHFVKLQKETAMVDLLNAARVLGGMPVPPDHLVLLEQITSPEDMGLVDEHMRASLAARSANMSHALGCDAVMNCKGSKCFYVNECPLKQAGIPDEVLANKPCVLELASAKHVFDSIMMDLFADTEEVRVSGVDAMTIVDVIRQEILVQRLHKCVRIKGEMYDIEEQGKFGVTEIPTVNPAIDVIERISASKAKNVKSLSLDRTSRFARGVVGSEAERIQNLRDSVTPIAREVSVPMIEMGEGDDGQ